MAAVLDQETAAPKQVSLGELRRPALVEQQPVRMGFDTASGFDLMQRGARLLAASSLVPKEYQGNLPNCVIALNMATRIGADPLLVMQNLYVVHGRPGWSSKFLIASFNQCGRFSAIRYEWEGKAGADDWGCRAGATEKATGEKITGPLITINTSKDEGWYGKTGSKWKTIPELMLMYRSAGWLVNTHAPEISMGLNTAEELHDVFDATLGADGKHEVDLEALRTPGVVIEQSTASAAGAPSPEAAAPQNRSAEAPAAPAPGVKPKGTAALKKKLIARFQTCADQEVLDDACDEANMREWAPADQGELTDAYHARKAELTSNAA